MYLFGHVSKQKYKLALTKMVPSILTEVQLLLRGFGSFSSRGVAKQEEGTGARRLSLSLRLPGATRP